MDRRETEKKSCRNCVCQDCALFNVSCMPCVTEYRNPVYLISCINHRESCNDYTFHCKYSHDNHAETVDFDC